MPSPGLKTANLDEHLVSVRDAEHVKQRKRRILGNFIHWLKGLFLLHLQGLFGRNFINDSHLQSFLKAAVFT